MPGPEEAVGGAGLGTLDAASLGQAMGAAARRLLRNPGQLSAAALELGRLETGVAAALGRRLLGEPLPAAGPAPGDRRFADPAWAGNPFLRASVEGYLAFDEWARSLVSSSGLERADQRKADFGTRLLLDAAAPSNVPWWNPAVVKEAIDTGGRSVVEGWRTWLDDVRHHGGRPRQVDTSPFEVGRNLAATPGRVVFRNDVMELLAYEPQTEEVFAEPLVCSPPWINKFYVMDLAPGRSFVEWAVQHGFTVFAISYKNPGPEQGGWTMDDYLARGWLAAIDKAAEITGSDRVNVVALCLGGTLSAIGLGYLAARGEADRVGWATLTNTLVDFSEPGELGVFTDVATVDRLDRQMRARGYLDAAEMAATFDSLRSNDLIWNYVVANWYMGRKPPAFDILAWNADATRMPAAMHAQYLRRCYVENALARPGALEVLGTPIDVSKIETPLYVLAAEADHIAPWRSGYRTTQLVGGEAEFRLSNSGHIAGIVNPPGNAKAVHWVGPSLPDDPDAWLAAAERRLGTWWEDWVRWASARSGAKVRPPGLPIGEPAPGRYVKEP